MKASRPRKEPQTPTLPERIRPELNVEKWSIWQPANSRNGPRARTIEREALLPDGQKLVAKLSIGFTDKGSLTTEEQRVYYALVRHWEDRGRPPDFIPLSLKRLAKLLRKPWGQKTRESLRRSLLKLRVTPFVWEQSYVEGATGKTLRLLDAFTILSDLKIICREDEGHVTREAGYFRFHEAITQNLLASHTKPVLFDVVLSFKSDIAQILYTHLDLILSDKTSYERRTAELFEDLGLEGETYRYASKRQEKLDPALKELQGVRLTTGTLTTAKLERTKDGADWKAVFRKGRGTALAAPPGAERPAEVMPLPTRDKQTAQAEELVGHFHRVFHGTAEAVPTGKALDQAAGLIARLGWEKARHVIDFAHREASKTRHRIATFGGILQYTTPALQDFEKTHGERERQRKAQAAVEAQRRRDTDERTRDEARRAEAKRYWEGLSPEERARVEREAFEQSNRWFLDQHRRYSRAGPQEEAETWRWRIIEAHLVASPEPSQPVP
jgi:hypothetical protein